MHLPPPQSRSAMPRSWIGTSFSSNRKKAIIGCRDRHKIKQRGRLCRTVPADKKHQQRDSAERQDENQPAKREDELPAPDNLAGLEKRSERARAVSSAPKYWAAAPSAHIGRGHQTAFDKLTPMLIASTEKQQAATLISVNALASFSRRLCWETRTSITPPRAISKARTCFSVIRSPNAKKATNAVSSG